MIHGRIRLTTYEHDRVREAREVLFADRGTPEQVALLEDQHLAPGFGEVRRADEAVVPAADDDGVPDVAPHQAFLRGGSKKGVLATRAVAQWRSYSQVTSIESSVPTAARSASTIAIARYFLRVGDQERLVA